jgi:hypothetical protein
MRNEMTDDYAAWCNAEQLHRLMSGTQFIHWLVDNLGNRCVDHDDSNVHMMTRNGELIHLYIVHSVWYCKA